MAIQYDCAIARHPALGAAIAAGVAPGRLRQLAAFYDQPHRHYHARAHILEMLDLALASGFMLSAAQGLAVLCHDAIYVPGAPRGSNELLSAQLLRVYCDAADAQVLEQAYAIVVDTAEHLPRCVASQLVLDLDLVRLGATPAEFARYSSQVFDEQRGLITLADDRAARAFFESRRASFFVRLLRREQIFREPALRDRFEDPARRNLRSAVERVRATDSRGMA